MKRALTLSAFCASFVGLLVAVGACTPSNATPTAFELETLVAPATDPPQVDPTVLVYVAQRALGTTRLRPVDELTVLTTMRGDEQAIDAEAKKYGVDFPLPAGDGELVLVVFQGQYVVTPPLSGESTTPLPTVVQEGCIVVLVRLAEGQVDFQGQPMSMHSGNCP